MDMKVILSKRRKDGSRRVSLVIDSWDLWKIDKELATLIHASLVQYQQFAIDRPLNMNPKQWRRAIDAITEAFKRKIQEEEYMTCKDNEQKIKKGIDLFEKYYQYIWF